MQQWKSVAPSSWKYRKQTLSDADQSYIESSASPALLCSGWGELTHPLLSLTLSMCISVCLGARSATNWKSVESGGDSREDQCVFTFPHPGRSAETLSDQSKQNPTETLSSPTWSVLSPDILEEVLQHSYQNSKILQLVPFLLYSEPGRYFCCNVQCWCIEGMTKVSQSVKLLLTNK